MMTDPAASQPGTHLDPDRIADLVEGLLDAAAADEARAHLASCPVCSADFALISGEGELDSLGNLSELLPPVPIPQDVVARIEAALYREPPLGTGAAAGGQSAHGYGAPAGPAASGHAAAAARPRRRRFRITLGALAGASLVVAGGFGLVTALSNATSESKGSSVSAGSAPSSQSADGSRAAAGTAPGAQMSPNVGAPDLNSGGTSAVNELTIQQQAKDLLGHRGATPALGTTGSAGLPCSFDGVTSGTKPLASTETRYQGRTAWLAIYAKPGSTTVGVVYVVDTDSCTPGNSGQVLDQFEIPRS